MEHSTKPPANISCLAFIAGLILPVVFDDPVFATGAAEGPLTAEEKSGKRIYVHGTSPGGHEILAYVGESSLEVPGRTMPCANCHGLDGRGKPEGGVIPSNLTWEALTKPYGVTHPGGRTHPPYTDRTLELAITRGLDPAGNKLLIVMPRYQLSQEDMADLVAYLKRLGKDRDPGLTENSITIGTTIPARADLAGIGEAIKAVTTAFFEEVNSRGGIYNRRIELKINETADTPIAANVKRFIQEEQVFAMTSAFIAGADKELAALMDNLEVPMVGPLTLYPQGGHPLNRHVFYVLSGVDGQARALANFACRKMPDKRAGVLVVYSDDKMAKGVLEAIKDQCQKSGCGPPETYRYPYADSDVPTFAAKLKQTNRSVIFFLGTGGEAMALMNEAAVLHWSPTFYLPGAVAGNEILDAPPSFSQKIFISVSNSPDDYTSEGIEEFRALAVKHKLPAHLLAVQSSAYSAAKILIEGLTRAGKDLSREKLIQALEGLYEYPTGVTPAVTYGINRRIGAMGAYVVTIDLEKKRFLPASGWIYAD
ncbi:MAG: ABC transporter substrate-binding protein [Gammaproteobacteria bacterium]